MARIQKAKDNQKLIPWRNGGGGSSNKKMLLGNKKMKKR